MNRLARAAIGGGAILILAYLGVCAFFFVSQNR